MPFEWMHTSGETSQRSTVSSSESYTKDVRARAELLHRLGYDQAYALHRCLGNVAWAFSKQGKPPLSPAQVRKIVAGVYARSK